MLTFRLPYVLHYSLHFFLTLPACFSSIWTYFLFQLFLFTLFCSLLIHLAYCQLCMSIITFSPNALCSATVLADVNSCSLMTPDGNLHTIIFHKFSWPCFHTFLPSQVFFLIFPLEHYSLFHSLFQPLSKVRQKASTKRLLLAGCTCMSIETKWGFT